MGKLERRTAASCADRCIDLIRRDLPAYSTITSDNGTELRNYRDVEAATGVEFYFATPHHSWERGTNEERRRTDPSVPAEALRASHT